MERWDSFVKKTVLQEEQYEDVAEFFVSQD